MSIEYQGKDCLMGIFLVVSGACLLIVSVIDDVNCHMHFIPQKYSSFIFPHFYVYFLSFCCIAIISSRRY